jgi:hypothetical protein
MTKQDIITLMCEVYYPHWGTVLHVEANDLDVGFTPAEMVSIRQRMSQVYDLAIAPYHQLSAGQHQPTST